MTTYCEPYYTTDYYTTVSDFFIEVGSSEQGMFISTSSVFSNFPIGIDSSKQNVFINTFPTVRVRSADINSSEVSQVISELLSETFKTVVIGDVEQDQASPAVSFSMEAGVSLGSVLQAIFLKRIYVGAGEDILIDSLFQEQGLLEISLSGTWGVSEGGIFQDQFLSEYSFGKIINNIVEALFQQQQTVGMVFVKEGWITLHPVSQGQNILECEVELYGRCFTISFSLDVPIVAVGETYNPIQESISPYYTIQETIIPRWT